jgi:plasmid stabilization system protein ParE
MIQPERHDTSWRSFSISKDHPHSGDAMPQGSKGAYTDKQKRQARHIERSYESRGVWSRVAARRAWATVNARDGGGKKRGSGRRKSTSTSRKRSTKRSR